MNVMAALRSGTQLFGSGLQAPPDPLGEGNVGVGFLFEICAIAFDLRPQKQHGGEFCN